MWTLSLAIHTTTLLMFAQPSQIQEQQVPYLLSSTQDSVAQSLREARSKIFRGGFSIFRAGPPPMTTVTLKPMSELPLDQSDTVILGEMTHMQPFLTYDRLGLYTECTITVLETIKSAFPITSEAIVLLRRGGEARLPDGRVVKWIVRGDGGLPVVGRQYLFFFGTQVRSRCVFTEEDVDRSGGADRGCLSRRYRTGDAR